jgi:hypothetical protein
MPGTTSLHSLTNRGMMVLHTAHEGDKEMKGFIFHLTYTHVQEGTATDDNLSWLLTGFDQSQLSQRPMTTSEIWSGCRLLNFCKKTNRLRFWLCPNGAENRTQLDPKSLEVRIGSESSGVVREQMDVPLHRL